jgi:hypothetical protein
VDWMQLVQDWQNGAQFSSFSFSSFQGLGLLGPFRGFINCSDDPTGGGLL